MASGLLTALRDLAWLRRYAALKSDVPRSAWAVVTSAGTKPKVILEQDETATEREVSVNAAGYLEAGWRVRVELVQKRLTIISAPQQVAALQAVIAGLVPYKTGKRRVLLGPEGDLEPAYELERTRPNYAAKGYMYLAANGSTTEFAIAVQDDSVTQATMRLTKNGIAYQDNVGSNGTRWVAYQNDLAAAVARIAALEAQLPQRGVAQLTIPANTATTGFVSVSFPRAFSGTPAVVASSSITSGAMNQVEVYVSAVTATGFQLRVTTATTATSATAAPVQWIAAIN